VKSRAEFFRQRAADCETQATRSRDVTAKAMLLEMAYAWRDLADHQEKLEQRTPAVSGTRVD
jgi:hypothetical protein